MLKWNGKTGGSQHADNKNYLIFEDTNGVWMLMNPHYKQWTRHISEQAAKDQANELYEKFNPTVEEELMHDANQSINNILRILAKLQKNFDDLKQITEDEIKQGAAE